MTNSDGPEAVFMRDQHDAASRDQQAWEMNVATIRADQVMKASHAKHTNARAAFWSALARLLSALAVAAWFAVGFAVGYALFVWDVPQ